MRGAPTVRPSMGKACSQLEPFQRCKPSVVEIQTLSGALAARPETPPEKACSVHSLPSKCSSVSPATQTSFWAKTLTEPKFLPFTASGSSCLAQVLAPALYLRTVPLVPTAKPASPSGVTAMSVRTTRSLLGAVGERADSMSVPSVVQPLPAS
ncbi:hypothetical protein D3C86_1694740 [compost metagenome]